MNTMKLFLLAAVGVALSACESDLQLPEDQWLGDSVLSINVLTDQTGTKGLIEGGYLPDKSKIGVSVTNATGGAYDGTTYHNILYTAAGTGSGQLWSGSAIPLSMNQGTCYAYYPYSLDVSDITAVPVSTSGQVDYMYATPVTVNAEHTSATLNMKHALAAVRFLLKRGSYAETGAVTAVSVTSAGVGTSGQLNAKTGDVSGVTGKGTAIGVEADVTLSEVEQSVDVLVVPTGTAADLTLSVTLDGKAYSTVVSSTTIEQSKCHKYTLTVNQGELALSSVKVGDWGYDESGAPTLSVGGHTITLAGDISALHFMNKICDDGSVLIDFIDLSDSQAYYLPSVMGTASMSKQNSGNRGQVTLSEIESDIILSLRKAIRDKVYLSASGTWTVPNGVSLIDAFLVGGGGAGNYWNTWGHTWGGNGSGGGTNTVLGINVVAGDELTYTIGSGGVANGGNGGATTLTYQGVTYEAQGGNGGKPSIYQGNGRDVIPASPNHGGKYFNGGYYVVESSGTWFLYNSTTNEVIGSTPTRTFSGSFDELCKVKTGIPEFWEEGGLLHAAAGMCYSGFWPVTDFTAGAGTGYTAGGEGARAGGGGYGGGGAGGWYQGSSSGKNGGQGVLVIRTYSFVN